MHTLYVTCKLLALLKLGIKSKAQQKLPKVSISIFIILYFVIIICIYSVYLHNSYVTGFDKTWLPYTYFYIII